MEITKEQLEKLTCLVGKQALKLIIPNAFEPIFSREKIYVYRNYKLHRVVGDEYAFIDMETSNCWANGSGNPTHLIKYAGKELKVFDSYKEYIKWTYENEM